jgi:hypothetical protein
MPCAGGVATGMAGGGVIAAFTGGGGGGTAAAALLRVDITVFSGSTIAAGLDNDVPHDWQNRFLGSFAVLQFGQINFSIFSSSKVKLTNYSKLQSHSHYRRVEGKIQLIFNQTSPSKSRSGLFRMSGLPVCYNECRKGISKNGKNCSAVCHRRN